MVCWLYYLLYFRRRSNVDHLWLKEDLEVYLYRQNPIFHKLLILYYVKKQDVAIRFLKTEFAGLQGLHLCIFL